MQKQQLEIQRHSCAHIVAAAVQELYPQAKFGVGPVVEDGFYYDIDFPENISEDELQRIEDKAKEMIKQGIMFERKEMPIDTAIEFFDSQSQDYKVSLLRDLKTRGTTKMSDEELQDIGSSADVVSLYQSDKFIDLCRGPHIENSKELNPEGLKLIKLAGAYWRGSEKNPQLQRIYGLYFSTREELENYLHLIEEAKKRDHRRLGKDLDLFSLHEEAGNGLVYWHPKGGMIRSIVEDYWKQAHFKGGYDIVYTPHIGKSWLWETSGHLDFFKEDMYSPMQIEDDDYYLKPMNCPFHIMMYKEKIHSYRDLPFRWAELGTVYRYEPSGVLHGLLRVRGFTQDDAHVICTEEQIEDEILEVLRFSLRMWEAFGFKQIKAYLATRPPKAIGDDKDWDKAVKSLEKAIKAEGLEYEVDEGGGAFYGPKIDLKLEDSLGREWQMTTIQFDFNLPERFDMTYVGADGKEHRPFMVHRALLGALERFFGLLIEHYAGAFPVWLSPVQIKLVPVSEKHNEGAKELSEEFKEKNIRVEIDQADETVANKVRKAVAEKVPYILVVGDKELGGEDLIIRVRGQEEQLKMGKSDFIEKILAEVEQKK